MKRVTIEDLNDHLGAYLRDVRQGQSVVVLDRERPIARLAPFEEGGAGLVIHRAKGRLRDAVLPPPVAIDVDVLALLAEERQRER